MSLRLKFFLSYLALVFLTLAIFTQILDAQLSSHAVHFVEKFNLHLGADGAEFLTAGPPGFVKELEQSMLWTALGVSALAALVSAGMTGYIVRPIQRLIAATRTLARSHYAEPIVVKEQDELGELAEAFNVMAESIHEHEFLQKQLITNMAHELGTPLTSLSGYLEALKDGLIPEENRSKVYDILSSELQRLSEMLEEVRTLALTQENHLPLKLETVNVGEELTRIVDTLRPQFDQKEITLNYTPQSPDWEATLDKNRFAQIVLNLLQNALKYSPEKTAVNVAVAKAPKQWTLSIEDHGEGIPQSELTRIFDRFYRVDKSRTRKTGGSGIGLALVKAFVKAHGGSISVTSTLGQGSTFTVKFPRG